MVIKKSLGASNLGTRKVPLTFGDPLSASNLRTRKVPPTGVSNLVVVDADDTNWHQRWQCQHWMTPIDTRMNWKIIYAGPSGLWKCNKIWSSGKCFWIHETSEMNFLQFLSNLAMKEENYFFMDTKIWVFSSHTTTKV